MKYRSGCARGVAARWPMRIRVPDSVAARVVINPGGQVYTGRKPARPAGKPSTLLISPASNTVATLAMYAPVLAPEVVANERDPTG